MIRYSLKCQDCSVEYDSWFSSSKEYERLKKLNFLNCENCGSLRVEKSIMSPNLTKTKKKSSEQSDLKFKDISITTNGRMFAYPDFTKNILNSGLTQIGLTMMGKTAKMHDLHTRAKGSFDQALMGIKNIMKYKNDNFSFLLNLMVTQKNYKDLVEIIDFYVGLGFKEINVGHIMPINRAITKSKSIVAQISKVTPYLVKCQKKHGNEVKFLFVEYPACSFSEKYRHLSFPCLEENPDKIRIKICGKCEYRDKCAGIGKSYLNLYGDKEFKI